MTDQFNNDETTPMIGDKLYDLMKLLVQLWIPAVSTLYFTLAAIWGLPAAEQVVGTLAALATFLGVSLRISNKSYRASNAPYDGVINITATASGTTLYSLELNSDPELLDTKSSVVFKVVPDSE